MKVIPLIIGVIVCIVFLLLIAGAIGYFSFRSMARGEASELISKLDISDRGVVTEKDLEGLPEPVQRYFRYTGIIGREKVGTVRLKMKGRFRMKPDQAWQALTAEEYYTIDPASFVWFGRISPVPLFSVTARDMYHAGKGNMLIRILSLFTVADATGRDIDEGAMIRFLSETIWFPSALLEDYVKWEPIDERSARVIMTEHGLEVSAVCHFNDKGELVNFAARRIYSETNKPQQWHTPIYEYREFNGIKIPRRGGAVWKLESGDFHYIDIEITEIQYNEGTTY